MKRLHSMVITFVKCSWFMSVLSVSLRQKELFFMIYYDLN